MWSMMKINQDNDMTDRTDAVYAENDTKSSWQIGLGMVCDENHTRQWRDWSYKSGLRWNRKWTVKTCLTRCGLWWKTREDNDMIDGISVFYIENNTKLSWPIRLGMICKEKQTVQQCDWSYRSGLRCNWNWTIGTYLTGCGKWWKLDKITTWLIV